MIYKYEDFIEALAELHPEVEEKSLEMIVKKGLQSVNRIMRSGQELIISNFITEGESNDWIKFFIYMTPEKQRKHALRNYYRKERKQRELLKEKEDA